MERIERKQDGRKVWRILIDTEDVFKRVSLDSNYREHALQEPRGSRYVLLDDDQALFQTLVKNAVAECWMQLARMGKQADGSIRYTEDSVEMSLQASDNHDDNMLFALGSYVEQFIDAWVLRQWFDRNRLPDHKEKCERDAATALSHVVTTVHFRRQAVKRPIHPIL